MPDAPDTGLFTHYVLENPWPAGIVLLAIAAVLAWTALRDGRRGRLKIAAGIALLALAIVATSMLVTTSGERAEALTVSLVDAAVAADVPAVMAHFAPQAVMSFASPRNPGFEIDYIARQAEGLQRQWRVESNHISMLDAYTISADEARVDLGCVTDIGRGTVPSTWVLRFRRQPDGSFKIDHITLISIMGQRASPDQLR